MLNEFDIEDAASDYWSTRCLEAESMVGELTEWIQNLDDEDEFDEEVYNMLARAQEIASRP